MRRWNLYAEICEPLVGADGERSQRSRGRRAKGVPFDSYFDFHDRSKLFCSELVATAIESAEVRR